MPKYAEDNLQMATARYLDMKNLIWCHVANERKTSVRTGSRLKKKGVKSGVPDVLIFNKIGAYSGLAIELKVKPNKLTKSQEDWLTGLGKQGWYTAVCYDINQVIKVIEKYCQGVQ